jgi:SAM-dependent methyltransferase
MHDRQHPASFRDPSGFMFRGADGQLYRQVNRCYEADYRRLHDSGLFAELTGAGLLIEQEEVGLGHRLTDAACRVLRPRPLPFISYPYEWSFGQLQDAALLTLEIQQRALARGLELKDASAFNVQFEGCRPVFIDTLSFATYEAGRPWTAYGQFCRHFLAPLAVMAGRDVRLGRLLAAYLDGLPLDLAARLLPWRSRWRPGLLMHLHLHAWSVRRHADTSQPEAPPAQRRISTLGLASLLDSLRRTVAGLRGRSTASEWADYTHTHGYTDAALESKRQIVHAWLDRTRPATVWDLGANTGQFSRLAAEHGAYTVACDLDPACVEEMYQSGRRAGSRDLLPLWLDLSNPSPGLGWAHHERAALADRGPADVVLALALVHHLAIGHNVPLDAVAAYLRRLGRRAVVEFVPKDDPQARRLLRSRPDTFADYDEGSFEKVLARSFQVVERQGLPGSGRSLWLAEAR